MPLSCSGPQPMDHAQRLALARDIAARVQRHFGERVLAIGIYGSVARGTDGPYSDTELFCVLRDQAPESDYEWSAGPWKAEVNVFGAEALSQEAARVEGSWPIRHGAVVHVLPLHDPSGYFARLREAALGQPESAFRRTMREVIVGDLYERVGKVRNARAARQTPACPGWRSRWSAMGRV